MLGLLGDHAVEYGATDPERVDPAVRVLASLGGYRCRKYGSLGVYETVQIMLS